VSYAAADLINFVESARKKRDASGSLGKSFKRASGPAGLLLA